MTGSKRGLVMSSVHEQAGKKTRRELGNHTTNNVPEDLIFDIICRLPVKFILKFRCLCKAWLDLIDSPIFINAHRQAQQRSNKSVLIFMRHLDTKSDNSLHNEPPSPLNFISSPSTFEEPAAPIYRHLYLLEVENGKGKLEYLYGIKWPCNMIAASNGLVLLKMDEQGGLVVLNPITRKLISLPPARMPTYIVRSPLGYLSCESYAITFISSVSDYKLVHLFRDELGYIQCETLILSSTRSWKPAVDWPTFRTHDRVGRIPLPVEAIGALHWDTLISKRTLVSVGIEDNKFYETELPKIGQDQVICRLLEMEGSLCCALADKPNDSIEIWLLKGLSGTQFIKHFTIKPRRGTFPIFYLRSTKELVLEKHSIMAVTKPSYTVVEMLACDSQLRTMRTFEVQGDRDVLKFNKFAPDGFWNNFRFNQYMPHIDCLHSWKS